MELLWICPERFKQNEQPLDLITDFTLYLRQLILPYPNSLTVWRNNRESQIWRESSCLPGHNNQPGEIPTRRVRRSWRMLFKTKEHNTNAYLRAVAHNRTFCLILTYFFVLFLVLYFICLTYTITFILLNLLNLHARLILFFHTHCGQVTTRPSNNPASCRVAQFIDTSLSFLPHTLIPFKGILWRRDFWKKGFWRRALTKGFCRRDFAEGIYVRRILSWIHHHGTDSISCVSCPGQRSCTCN